MVWVFFKAEKSKVTEDNEMHENLFRCLCLDISIGFIKEIAVSSVVCQLNNDTQNDR